MEGIYYSWFYSFSNNVIGIHMSDVDKVYKEFWEELITTNGKLDIEKIKKELHDYHFILEQIPKVYSEVTDNKISKPNTYADEIISCFNDYVQELVEQEIENNEESLSHLEPQIDALNDEIDNLKKQVEEKNKTINDLLRKLNAKYTIISSNKKI